MSDSDSDCDWEDIRDRYLTKNDTIVAFRPSDESFERWVLISAETRRDAGQRMRICAFWLPILLQREESGPTVCWALQLGLTSNGSDEISLKNLNRIEIVEAILRALERGTVKRDQTKQVVLISNMFNLRSSGVLDDALQWLERTGEPNIRHRVMDLGHTHMCHTALHLIFTEFAKYIQEMGSHFERTMKSLTARPAEYLIEKSEDMKKKGNENFQKKQYEDAVKFYSKAITFYPDNHIVYGNRALCYIRSKKYLKAVGDGKCATLIKPFWAKGHYRYCEALFFLGEIKKAIDANLMAQHLCRDDHEGFKDLEQQHLKFAEMLMPDPKAVQPKKTPTKRPESTNRAKKSDATPQIKVTEVKLEKTPVKNERTAQSDAGAKNSKPSKSELSSKNGRGTPSTPKKKPKNVNQSEEENQKDDDEYNKCSELRSMVQDAHTALADLRSRNAEQAFRKALVLVEASTPKDLGLSTLDELLLLYGLASALTEIGQLEELGEAQKLLDKIKSFEERTFQCLVYYAVGRVYLRENRFALALEQFSDSLQTVKNRITPGKLTWPLTKEIVKETQSEYFKEILEHAIELCRFPPIPDAICRLEKCLVPLKAEIYLTDPDFKGFIRICCCKSCIVEYHTACWKTLKTSSFDKNEKEFLQDPCLTPDCVGQICNIKIFSPTGLIKCKFEALVAKPQTLKKPKVNQKCTSLKKLKSREDHKLKRNQHKQSFLEKQAINDEILQKDDSATHSQQKAWLQYRDRVLLQISENMELLREEKGLHVSLLTDSLKPWLELDSSRGNQVAGRILNWQQEPLETLSDVVELLLERKNRVWARVLIQLLSGCLDIDPKLSNWALQLNNAGLNAAKSFIERFAGHLEQLDLAFLLNFGPLQDVIIEKLGTRPELFSSAGLTVTEYLNQAPAHDMRLFIWTLEEHRDEYLTCHHILDGYFDMMDGHCSVLKKSDENQNNSPLKSRGRKKKQREPRGVFVWSEMTAPTPRDDWEQDLFEDDSLSFLHPGDPFSVPSHLREQVADFEDQYNSTRHRSHYKQILDNNPDPTKESLYDYFAQILEEHGPLVAEDPLLVGELGNFPSVAQLKIQETGGFEAFLLESLRFIKMGRCIGLAKHAVSLQQAVHGAGLDYLDVIADPGSDSLCLDERRESAFTSYLDGYSSAQTDVYRTLPNPYVIGSQPATRDELYLWTIDDRQPEAPYVLPNDYGELDPDLDLDLDGGLLETSSTTTEGSFLKKHAEVQTCQESMRSVAVNTEIHKRFESCPGHINIKQKSNRKLEQQIKKMAKGCDKVNLRHEEDVAVLKEDIQKITANIQVTNKELALFQQKLEEEVKKDQKEKKANQEGLKALKTTIEDLVEQHGSLSQNIREKKASFDSKLSDSLELSNQSAAEKMSLEDEIKRCKLSFTSATRRSQAAQVLVVESSRDQGLFVLYRELATGKALLTKLDEAAHRYPSPDLEMTRNSWRVNVQDVEKKISTAEAQYKEQLDQVNNGRRLSELPPVNVNNQSEPPAAPSVAATEYSPPSSSSHGAAPVIPPPAAEAAAAQPPAQLKPPARTLEPQHNTVFDKSLERLTSMFPDYTRSDLMRFVQEFRSSSGGSLSSMSMQDMVGGVTQLILDHQEKPKAAKASKAHGVPSVCTTPPLVAPVWRQKRDNVQSNVEKLKAAKSPAQYTAPPYAYPVWNPPELKREAHSNALNIGDPCIICHEDMNPIDICVLVCRHSFHNECIRSWLKEQSTCPTCRDHALLPEEFPALSGRRRQAP
ncbi:E3 ubiquitin-protein ligase TTC3 isoform X2 [Anarrhichthys ocellatus]|uniref:E3 ubiquitin-protein ligase TTC3 isoform X2 n=1 Tax=Anarrhichthys ocellatus TaxID=433405 RepID=UPI0012ECE132|nr:E3 ubiquitin-protein ligase TTC3-like isoform X2 [Anarrhichthys ocellatus]